MDQFGGSGSPGDIIISKVFDRGDWILTRDDREIVSSDGLAVVHGEEFVVPRDGECLRLTIKHSEPACYMLVWS